MQFEIITTKEPERDPAATTGDPVPRAEIIVGWPGIPSDRDMRAFENQYPPHFYDAFHWHNYED